MAIAAPAIHAPATVEFFESIYGEARGDVARIPWAEERPHPALVNWLNAVAPSVIRCGARVAVVGCGLGDDALELLKRGYDVTAFDCSPTAVRWARERDPEHASAYVVADLFEPPARWRHRFDLVVEVNNLQALLPEQRGEAMRCMTDLMSRHGGLLVIGRATGTPVSAEGDPPWPLTENDLRELASDAGLAPDGPVTIFADDEKPSVLRMRALLRHQ
jgi:SAM-dependent methyltransferase